MAENMLPVAKDQNQPRISNRNGGELANNIQQEEKQCNIKKKPMR
jgi:hypothetical protein